MSLLVLSQIWPFLAVVALAAAVLGWSAKSFRGVHWQSLRNIEMLEDEIRVSEAMTGEDAIPANALVSVRKISRSFRMPREKFFVPAPARLALAETDFDLIEGESLAIIGESGAGKTTLIRAVLGLDQATSGSVFFGLRPVHYSSKRDLQWLRRETGIVFQDPYSSLDPRQTVYEIIAEPLQALAIAGDHRAMVRKALEQVELEAWREQQYPHELSGGQRQRVALARALVHGPKILVGDEPLSALDLTVRAQILELLKRLRSELNLSMILVTHDIGLVQHLCDTVLVMKDGHIVESGRVEQVLQSPRSSYTRTLIASIPTLSVPDSSH